MLRYKLWSIKIRLLRLLNYIICQIKRLFNTLIGCIIQMLIIVFGLLLLIFGILPKKAYVNYQTEDYSFAGYEFNEMTADIGTSLLSITFESFLGFFVKGTDSVVVDGVLYDIPNMSVRIQPKVADTAATFSVSSGTEPIYYAVENGTIVFEKSPFSNKHIRLAAFKCRIGANNLKLYDLNNIIVKIYNQDNEVIVEAKDNIQFQNSYSLVLHMNVSEPDEHMLLEYSEGYETNASYDIYGISASNIKSSGLLELIYSRKPDTYEINDKILELENKNTARSEPAELWINLSYDYAIESDHLYAYALFKDDVASQNIFGTVHDIKLSGYSLFVSFWGWYTENIALIPLSIITTIIGGVALVYKKR